MQPAETPHANFYRTENFTLERISRERHLYSNMVIRPTITCWRIHWLSSRLREDKVGPYGLLLPLSTATCNQFTNRKSTGLSSTQCQAEVLFGRDGSFDGTWKYIPKDLVIGCWYYEKRDQSLGFFSKLGYRTLAAAYYDADNLENPKGWIESLDRTQGAIGIMYTTWEHFCSSVKITTTTPSPGRAFSW